MERIGPFQYQRHEPRVPPCANGRETTRHRVVIAGGGPIGLAVALALARWGVASVVLEADTTVCEGSRAICISRRSLEILGQLGALEAHLAKGLPWEGGRTFHGTDQILHFTMPHDARQKLPPMINIQQYWIEQFLVDAADRLVDIRWGSELTGFNQDDDGVSLTVRAGGSEYTMQGDWLVACDGGQSFVRKSLGLKLNGAAFEGKYVIADFTLPSGYPAERRAWFDPPSNPGSTVLMHKQPDDLWRIDYQIPDDADLDEALRPENVSAFIERHLQMLGEAHLPWEIVWISAYRAGAMTLERYRHGRILFAGNAAHAMPIFGVRGLNSGFEDAHNLGWKLASVVSGLAHEALLDTYDTERRHAFDVNAASAIKSTEFMAPPSRGFSLMREAALTLAHRHRPIAQLANPRQTTAIGYPDSALNLASDAFDVGPAPGDPPLECPVRGPAGIGYLSDVLGAHWTVMVFLPGDSHAPSPGQAPRHGSLPDPALDLTLDQALGVLERGPLPLRTVIVAQRGSPFRSGHRLHLIDDAQPDGGAAALYGARRGAIYLLRPDGHVAGRWRRIDGARLREAIDVAAVQVQSSRREFDQGAVR